MSCQYSVVTFTRYIWRKLQTLYIVHIQDNGFKIEKLVPIKVLDQKKNYNYNVRTLTDDEPILPTVKKLVAIAPL